MVRQEPAKLPFPSSNLGATFHVMLILVPTPIGNLADFTQRAIDCLCACDYILCEDTRHSLKLLKAYSIEKPLKSFHAFNEAKIEERIVQDLREGKQIALLSDAGTPLIADPGYALVRRCIQEELPVSALPGPCAAILALVLSGFPPLPFQCVGFLPKRKGLRTMLRQLLEYSGTSIAYESPHRIQKTLSLLVELDPERRVCVARELTKMYEELIRGTARDVLARLPSPRGEYVLLIAPKPAQKFASAKWRTEDRRR